ncbi:MAG: hypothetical protein V7776_21375 [Halopseudomonas aestusnigri]
MKYSDLAHTVLFLGGLLSIPQLAGADPVNISTGSMAIGSDGTQYVIKDFGALTANVELEAGADGRLKNWTTFFKLRTEEVPWDYFEESKSPNQHYTWLDNITGVEKTVPLEMPSLSFTSYVLNKCNGMANNLRQSGLGDAAIFSVDRNIEISVIEHFDFSVYLEGDFGTENYNWGQAADFTVTCEKWPGASVQADVTGLSTAAPVVLGSWLFMEETSLPNGYCKMKLNGTFEASQPGLEVEFHYEDNNGLKSDKKTAVANANADAAFSHEYGAPYNAAGPVSGTIKIVGDSHEFESQPMNYVMDCAPAGKGQTQFSLVQPPQIKIDAAIPENYTMLADKRVCPMQTTVYGGVSTNGTPFDGFVALQVQINGQNHYSSAEGLHLGANGSWPVPHTVDLDWSSQTPNNGTIATANSTGPTSMTVYGKVKLYNADMEPIQPIMPLIALKVECSGTFASVQSSLPQALVNQQSVTRAGSPKKSVKRAGTPDRKITRAGIPKQKITRAGIAKQKVTRAGTPAKAVTRSTAKANVTVLPDLVVKSASTVGQGIWRIKVANIGKAKSAPTTIWLKGKNGKSLVGKVGALNKRQSAWVTVKSGSLVVSPTIMIDPRGQVVEANEKNNRLKVR